MEQCTLDTTQKLVVVFLRLYLEWSSKTGLNLMTMVRRVVLAAVGKISGTVVGMCAVSALFLFGRSLCFDFISPPPAPNKLRFNQAG